MKIAWLYHDFMDLYGDKGNIMVLQKRCEDRGIPCQVDKIGIGDETDLCDYDLIFLGGGADKEQLQLIPDLMARRENIRKAMDEGTFALLICGDISCSVNTILPQTVRKSMDWDFIPTIQIRKSRCPLHREYRH